MLLTQSNIRVTVDQRVSIDSNHSLRIMDIKSTDQGVYRCLVLPNQIDMNATLIVQTHPQARIFRPDGRDVSGKAFTVSQGDRVELECRGTGRPEPAIKWSSEGERLVTSFGITVEGGKLTIEAADYHHSRLYQCLADNGVSVGHATITVTVRCE